MHQRPPHRHLRIPDADHQSYGLCVGKLIREIGSSVIRGHCAHSPNRPLMTLTDGFSRSFHIESRCAAFTSSFRKCRARNAWIVIAPPTALPGQLPSERSVCFGTYSTSRPRSSFDSVRRRNDLRIEYQPVCADAVTMIKERAAFGKRNRSGGSLDCDRRRSGLSYWSMIRSASSIA
jgi:hypothetical protein